MIGMQEIYREGKYKLLFLFFQELCLLFGLVFFFNFCFYYLYYVLPAEEEFSKGSAAHAFACLCLSNDAYLV